MTADILVVDDMEELRETLAEFLRDKGYSVITASNGAEALERLLSGPRPSLVLMDLEMPMMSGWEVLASLGQNPDLASLPVIVVSGASVDIEKLAVAAHVRKPVDLAQLGELVARFIRQVEPKPRVSAPVLGQVVKAGASAPTPGTAEPVAAGPADPPIVAEQEPAAADPAAPAADKIGDP